MDRLKVATKSQDLTKILRIDLKDTGIIQWNIRFNLPLCRSSVNNQTVKVFDNIGKKILCNIDYDQKKQTIIIYPLDHYEIKKCYTLVITRHVKSTKKNHLKKEIRLLFMINN